MEVERVRETAERLTAALTRVVGGQERPIRDAIVALVAGGHVLAEGPPGLGKTLLVRTLARLVRAEFRRIQFTPDLMPADVMGTSVFRPQLGDFVFAPGPIFTQFLLADEINRTPPKTQAALLEAMQERQVTLDGTSRALSPAFFVVATQNPVEYEGTYPLPEAQLDRFFMKIRFDYPDAEAERRILDSHAAHLDFQPDGWAEVQPVIDVEELLRLRAAAGTVFVAAPVRDYIVQLVAASRNHRHVALGASSRAAITLLFAAKTRAACEGREFLRPDDVKSVAVAVLRHRLVLRPDAEVEGLAADQVVDELLAAVEVPRGAGADEA